MKEKQKKGRARILLVRHGEDEDNAAGILNGHRQQPLTERGRGQARAVAQKLKEYPVSHIYTSPLKRARETAEAILQEFDFSLPLEVHPLLIERDFGVLTGKGLAEIPRYAKKILEGDRVVYFLKAEGAEPFPEVRERAEKFVKEMDENHPDETVIAVTHGNTGKMVRAAYNGWGWERGLKTPYFDNTEILILG